MQRILYSDSNLDKSNIKSVFFKMSNELDYNPKKSIGIHEPNMR